MRRHILIAVGGFLTAAVAAVGQPPPRTLPPALIGSPAVSPVSPVAGTTPDAELVPPAVTIRTPANAPLAKLEPLEALPAHTQQAVRSALLGAGWLVRMNQPQGRFLYGYLPALRQPMDGDHDLRQAAAALALAQAARFTGDERATAVASQAVLTLLTATRVDPADAACRVPVAASGLCNRVGFAALLVLCVHELPADPKLAAEADRLCEFLRRCVRPDGSVHYTDGPADVPTTVDPAGLNEYPGLALQAVAASHRAKPAAWKAEAMRAGLAHYRALFRSKPHPQLAASLTPAFADWYLQTPTPDAAAAVFEMNDWLTGLQYATGDAGRHPLWAGGFRGIVNGRPTDDPPGLESAGYVQSLAWACRLTRQVPDLGRYAKYRQAMLDGSQFLAGLQYGDANTRHFETNYRSTMLVGGFYRSPTDGNLRIDRTAHAVSALLRLLQSGAERN